MTTLSGSPAAEILQALIRFDTTNPPGAEAACIAHVERLLREAGIAARLYTSEPGRPNLVARIAGGSASPLLLQGHVDVVTTAGQQWRHPPFAAVVDDGCVWGRGALDMKGGVAMMVAAFVRAKAEAARLPGDVILCLVSDEEAGGTCGARFLVEQHADLFSGVRFSIGEGGGHSLEIGGRRFFQVMVEEKQTCSVRALLRGPGGHGSRPLRGGAMARLGRLLVALDGSRLPVHITPVVRLMLETMAGALDEPLAGRLRSLLDPAQTDLVLDQLGEEGRQLDALLHNVVNPTIVQGGSKINVIPSQVVLELDGRLLPGFTDLDMLAEVQAVAGPEVALESFRYQSAAVAEPDLALFPALKSILEEAAAGSVAVPYLLPAVTDGRHFARLGIQNYGFVPVLMSNDLVQTIHAADERIPVEGLEFGAEALYQALLRFA